MKRRLQIASDHVFHSFEYLLKSSIPVSYRSNVRNIRIVFHSVTGSLPEMTPDTTYKSLLQVAGISLGCSGSKCGPRVHSKKPKSTSWHLAQQLQGGFAEASSLQRLR